MAFTLTDLRQLVLRSALPMAGSAINATADTLFPLIDAQVAKLMEDRNISLADGGIISVPALGTTVTFSQVLNLHVNSRVAGGSPQVISLAATTRTLSADGRMIYAVINRTAGTATVTDDSATLPAVTSANQEVVLIAKRSDSADGTKRVYFRGGFSLSAGQSSRLGTAGTLFASEFSVADATDTTKKIIIQASGSATAVTTTVAFASTVSRVITMPDATDTLVGKATTDTLTNKTLTSPVINTPLIDIDSFTEQGSVPSTPASGKRKFYAKSDGVYQLDSTGSETKLLTTGTINSPNFLINSNFDFWQRGTTTTVANTVSAYLADRWYVKNSLGTNGILTYSQVAGVSLGAKYGAKVQITTAPTASQANGTEIYQVIENLKSLELYNQNAIFQVKAKSFGNVTQIGLQFFYATTEVKVTTAIGSEQLFTVNSSTFSTLSMTAQALGTSQTTSGVIGIRVRVTAVSTGNTYDINNGFVIEQGMLNAGSSLSSTYQKMYPDLSMERLACKRFYHKNSDLPENTAFSYSGSDVYAAGGVAAVTANLTTGITFPVEMRATPSISVWNYSAGTTNQWHFGVIGQSEFSVAVGTTALTKKGFQVISGAAAGGTYNNGYGGYSANVEI